MTRRFAAALLALATGCAAPASHLGTTPTLPAHFTLSGSDALPDRWWMALPDPALAALVERALSGNLDLQIAWSRLAQADAQVRGATAATRPSLTGDLSGGVRARGDGGGSSADASASLGLGASYELDLWGRVAASRDAAVLGATATAHDVHAAAISLTAELALTWYRLVEARATDALLVRQLATSEETLRLVSGRVDAGLVASDDLLRQLQSVEALRAQRALAAGHIAVLEHRLALLVGVAPTTPVAPAGEVLVELPPLPVTGVPATLLQRRPDVIAAHTRVLAADRDVAAAIAERYPRLTLSARASIDAPFTGWLTSLLAGLTAPLYDGGRLAAQVDGARAALEQRVLGYQQAVLAAAAEVEDALVNEQQQRAYLASLDRQLALSERTLAAARGRYTAGLADYLRVLEAEQSLQGLEKSKLSAQADLIANRIGLYRALAGEWGLTRAR